MYFSIVVSKEKLAMAYAILFATYNSMEEQVISRAHRMGATRPISVETLAMHGTIEEQMVKFLQVFILSFLQSV